MTKQMTLRLQRTEELVMVWGRLEEASKQALVERLASLIAAAARTKRGPETEERSDDHRER